jgi:hypothetical protein
MPNHPKKKKKKEKKKREIKGKKLCTCPTIAQGKF